MTVFLENDDDDDDDDDDDKEVDDNESNDVACELSELNTVWGRERPSSSHYTPLGNLFTG